MLAVPAPSAHDWHSPPEASYWHLSAALSANHQLPSMLSVPLVLLLLGFPLCHDFVCMQHQVIEGLHST